MAAPGSSSFPQTGFPFVDSDGRITTPWLRFLIGLQTGTASGSQPANILLTGLSGMGIGTGFVAQIAAAIFSKRTLTGSSPILIANGDGVSGNPTFTGDIASSAEVIAGTDPTKIVTPLGLAAALVSNVPTGSMVDSITTTYATNTALATVIPLDDTIPQVGEGTEILSVVLTPKTITNKLRCRFFGEAAGSGIINVSAAMFVNGAANAVQATTSTIGGASYAVLLAIEYEFTPASLSPQTISIRVGPSSGSMRMNGTNVGRLFGGVSLSTLVVEEIKA